MNEENKKKPTENKKKITELLGPEEFTRKQMGKMTNEEFAEEFHAGKIPLPDDAVNVAVKVILKLIAFLFEGRKSLKNRVEKLEDELKEAKEEQAISIKRIDDLEDVIEHLKERVDLRDN